MKERKRGRESEGGEEEMEKQGVGGCLVLGKVNEKHLIREGSKLLMLQFIAN